MNCRNVLFKPVAEQGVQSGADSQNKQRLRGIDAFDSDHRQQRHGKYGCNRPDLIHKFIQAENIKFRLITRKIRLNVQPDDTRHQKTENSQRRKQCRIEDRAYPVCLFQRVLVQNRLQRKQKRRQQHQIKGFVDFYFPRIFNIQNHAGSNDDSETGILNKAQFFINHQVSQHRHQNIAKRKPGHDDRRITAAQRLIIGYLVKNVYHADKSQQRHNLPSVPLRQSENQNHRRRKKIGQTIVKNQRRQLSKHIVRQMRVNNV